MNNENLKMFNEEEMKEYLEMKKLIDQQQQELDYKPHTTAKCTKFCSKTLSEAKCNRGNFCTFAHHIDDWSPVTCNFGIRCNRKTTNCSYIHPDETKDLYAKRINQKLPPPPQPPSDYNHHDDIDDDDDIDVIIDIPYVSVPKECEEMIKEALKNRGIKHYTFRTF